MRIPVNEKNLRIIQANIGDGLPVGDLIEPFTPLSIYKAYFTNARAMKRGWSNAFQRVTISSYNTLFQNLSGMRRL